MCFVCAVYRWLPCLCTLVWAVTPLRSEMRFWRGCRAELKTCVLKSPYLSSLPWLSRRNLDSLSFSSTWRPKTAVTGQRSHTMTQWFIVRWWISLSSVWLSGFSFSVCRSFLWGSGVVCRWCWSCWTLSSRGSTGVLHSCRGRHWPSFTRSGRTDGTALSLCSGPSECLTHNSNFP